MVKYIVEYVVVPRYLPRALARSECFCTEISLDPMYRRAYMVRSTKSGYTAWLSSHGAQYICTTN